jgi:hypothetical protein
VGADATDRPPVAVGEEVLSFGVFEEEFFFWFSRFLTSISSGGTQLGSSR